MNETQRKWLLYLQEKGIKFEYYNLRLLTWQSEHQNGDRIRFNSFEQFRIPAQPVPDIPDWRELCWEMQSNGVLFSRKNPDGVWVKSHFHEFAANEVRERHRIPEQPIPEWKEPEMTEETKPDPREEIPHRELQIQWHEDWIHALKTEEEMREWEVRLEGSDDEWITLLPYEIPDRDNCEYRRKPKMKKVPMWYCIGQNISNPTEFNAFGSMVSRENIIYQVSKSGYELIGAVTQIEVEIPEDKITE